MGSCLLGSFAGEPAQTCHRVEENGEQHVIDPCTTVDSMRHLLHTLAFCFWCALLLYNQAAADEEAHWGPTPSRENPPEKKQTFSWWPKFPFPSLSLPNPFYRSSDNNAAAPTTPTKEPTEPADHLQDQSGSGERSISEAPTTLTQGLPTSVTNTGPQSLPTSDSPDSSITQSTNDPLVSNSYSPTSSSIRNTLFTNSPTNTGNPAQNTKHSHPTAQAVEPGLGATLQHLPGELTDEEEAKKFAENIYSTISPETTVPTALTWTAAKTTTTIPGLVETTLTGGPPVTPPQSSETMSVTKPLHSTASTTLHAREATVTKTHPTQSESDLGAAEATSGPMPGEKPGVITMGINEKPVPESITSSTPRQRVNFPIEGGKQISKQSTVAGLTP